MCFCYKISSRIFSELLWSYGLYLLLGIMEYLICWLWFYFPMELGEIAVGQNSEINESSISAFYQLIWFTLIMPRSMKTNAMSDFISITPVCLEKQDTVYAMLRNEYSWNCLFLEKTFFLIKAHRQILWNFEYLRE